MTQLSTTLYRWHRRIGLAVFTAIIAWALSGLSHPIMARLNPRPAFMHPPVSATGINTLSPLSAALSTAGITQFEQAQILNIDSKIYYRIENKGQSHFIDAQNGQITAFNDTDYAQSLARYYMKPHLGTAIDSTAIDKNATIESITQFDEEYLSINRFLPVYKVGFNTPGHMRAYVELSTGRLATLIDDRKAFIGKLFRQLHSWTFIGNPWLRTLAMSILLIAGIALSAIGLWISWQKRTLGKTHLAVKQACTTANQQTENEKKSANIPTNTARWHKRLGLSVGVFVLTFSVSGLFHLLAKPIDPPPAIAKPPTVFKTADLSINWQAIARIVGQAPLLRGTFVQLEGTPFLRLELEKMPDLHTRAKPSGHQHHPGQPRAMGKNIVYINATSSQRCIDCENQHAINLAKHYITDKHVALKTSTPKTQIITQFNDDYGFINKRLPVHAVSFAGQNTTIFVETLSDTLAATADNTTRIEGWSFSNLHKWHFLTPWVKPSAISC